MEDAEFVRCFDHDAHDHRNSTPLTLAQANADSDRH
jgi:hypothetical protein